MVTSKKNKNSDLSEAARIMRTDPDPKKRSEAASKMGEKGGPIGGAHSHSGGRPKKGEDE
jgi:hypothetical protein